MSRNQGFDQSYNLSGKVDDRKSYPAFVGKEKKVTCCQKDKSINWERSKRDDLLNKLQNLRPKYAPELFRNDDDCITEFSSKKIKHKKTTYVDRTSQSPSERTKRSIVNPGKVSFKESFYSRRNEVCDRLDESSRSSNKMQCYCYDQSQERHYSRRYFEKFQYGTEATSLEAMSSSLDVSPRRMNKEKPKSSFSTYKKEPCAKKNYTNLSGERLVVNRSPGANIDFLTKGKIKKRRSLKKTNLQDLLPCQYSSESSPDEFEKKSRGLKKNQKEILDVRKKCRDKVSEDEKFDRRCEVEENVEASCSHFSRSPANSDYSENLNCFQLNSNQSKINDSKCKCCSEDDTDYREEESDDEEYGCPDCEERNNENISDNNEDHVQSDYRRNTKSTKNIRLQDLTPNIEPLNHWTQCGEHLTKIANQYRQLSDKLKSMQSLTEDQSSDKTIKKKFNRTYPSGKKLSLAVKSAEEFCSQNCHEFCCECNDCPLFLKTWENINGWGSKESKILKRYNMLTNKSKHLSKGPLNKNIDGERSQCSSKCQETFIKSSKQKKPSKYLDKKELNLYQKKSYHARNDTEKKILKDKKLQDKKVPECNINFPRIVKPDGSSRKSSLRKILIYPPHGEEGPPLILCKKFSNIDCRIKGDATNGFRYKVTYKQKFVSPIWHPKCGTSPFRKKENTTDYG